MKLETHAAPHSVRERERENTGREVIVVLGGEENGGNVRWSGEVLMWGDIERKNGFNE